MFGWQRRNDGFEWRDYIRTTVLARRAERQQKLVMARRAALVQSRAFARRSGDALVYGLRAGGRGLALAAEAAAAGARAAAEVSWRGVRQGARAAGKTLAAGGKAAAAGLGPYLAAAHYRLAPVRTLLQRRDVAIQLTVAGCGLLLAIFLRALSPAGFDAAALWTLAASIIAFLLAGWPLKLALGGAAFVYRSPWFAALGAAAGAVAAAVALPARRLWPKAGSKVWPWVLRGGAAAAGLALSAWAVSLGLEWWQSSAPAAGSSKASAAPSVGDPAGPLKGRALALAGDRLRLAGVAVRLSGIEAPEREQECVRANEKRWRCGVAAHQALARLIRGRTITCATGAAQNGEERVATCHAGSTDIAAELVRRGLVFAEAGFFAPYTDIERKAREEKAGLWQGTAERPAEYRARRWEEAKRTAPSGCPIKGQVTAEGRVYVLPWSGGYSRAKVRQARGDRWFCSEAEARSAGWKPGRSS